MSRASAATANRDETTLEGLQTSPEAWAELIHRVGMDKLTLLIRNPQLLRAELQSIEERLQGQAGQRIKVNVS